MSMTMPGATEAVTALIFVPLLAALAAAVLPARFGRLLALVSALLMPLLLWRLGSELRTFGSVELLLAEQPLPLGIRLQLDGATLLMLWLVACVVLASTVHAARSIGAARRARRFWPAWLVLVTGLHTLLLSADLFNLYIGLELVTLAAVALIACNGRSNAIRAALRYLLLAMLASLAYLLGVAVLLATTGTLDLALAFERGDGALPAIALALMAVGLLLKSAVFPLHGWLPAAHASAPGPVSAVLSALVVKVSLFLLYRLWFGGSLPPAAAGQLLAVLGAGAVLYGSLLALRQQRLKRVVAYSTVAQLGYLMLLFALPGLIAWQATMLQMLSHGLAKAGMFLAAANLLQRLGSDRIDCLNGADARAPLSVFAFGIAAVSLMGLPPSGGFLAKWLLLTAAWEAGAWWIIAVLAIGSLLAAAYLFRALAAMLSRTRPTGSPPRPPAIGQPPGRGAELAALALAVAAIVLGFVSAPLLELLSLPPALAAPLDGAAR
jgi:multicomponent Na+:H+ antiporter subunit D